MSRRLRVVALLCAALWLTPVAVFAVMMLNAWFGSREPSEDPHGYVQLFGLLFALPVAAFAFCTVRALWLVARRRRGAGTWLLVVGLLGGGAGVLLLPGALLPPVGPGTPGVEQSWPYWPLVAMAAGPLVLAVITLVAASRITRAERPLVPPQGYPPAWPPVAPGR